jgi:hypothetical protein
MTGLVLTRTHAEERAEEIGFWSDDIWYPVIKQLDEDIAALVPDYSLDQLKEKFGGLRYYVSMPDHTSAEVFDAVHALIRKAEDDCHEITHAEHFHLAKAGSPA